MSALGDAAAAGPPRSWHELKELMAGPPLLRLGVAESLTAGHLQTRVGSISGASTFFCGGLTAYTLDQKVRHLGIDRAGAEAVEAVSESVAQDMARGACRFFGSELGVAITGFAERPPVGRGERPFAWWALCHVRTDRRPEVLSGRLEADRPQSRTEVQQAFADAVMDELIRYLRGWRRDGRGAA